MLGHCDKATKRQTCILPFAEVLRYRQVLLQLFMFFFPDLGTWYSRVRLTARRFLCTAMKIHN